MAVGLDYPDLFVDSCINKRTLRPPAPSPWPDFPWDPIGPPNIPFRWKWRRQCAELEQAIQANREHAEEILHSTQGLDINALSDLEFDEIMNYIGKAYDWLARCERLDALLKQPFFQYPLKTFASSA